LVDYPILSNCEIKLTKLVYDIQPSWAANSPALRGLFPGYSEIPYLWMIVFKIDGLQTRFVIEKVGGRFIGKFQLQEGWEIHVDVRPGSPGGITNANFGHGNIGGGMEYGDERNIESIFVTNIGYPFKFRFGDLVPIPYSVPIFDKSGNIPAIIGCITLLFRQYDTPNSAVLEGAQTCVEAIRDGLNSLIVDFEHDFTDYINQLDFTEPPEVILPTEEIDDLKAVVKRRVTQAIERKTREETSDWDKFLYWIGVNMPDELVGIGDWIWQTDDLIDDCIAVEDTRKATRYITWFSAELVKGTQQFHWPDSPDEIPMEIKKEIFGELIAEKIKCFIASATFGSELYPRLNLLRNWRDKVYNNNRIGQELIHLYYEKSPFFANIVSRSKHLRILVRRILKPIINSIHRHHPKWQHYRSK